MSKELFGKVLKCKNKINKKEEENFEQEKLEWDLKWKNKKEEARKKRKLNRKTVEVNSLDSRDGA